MAYVKQVWENLPSVATPLSATRLNKLETQYDEAAAYTDQKVDVDIIQPVLAAQAAAELARDQAVTAKTGAETAQGGAETARTGAETARTGALAAQSDAEDARDIAIVNRGAAETAAAAAGTARNGAEAARDAAAGSATAASGSATAASGFKDDAEDARDAAEAIALATGNLAGASATTVPYGQPATVSLTGPLNARVAAFEIPAGQKGDTGAAGGMVVVKHGSNPGIARPTADSVYWVGSVEPTNAVEDDIWKDTSA